MGSCKGLSNWHQDVALQHTRLFCDLSETERVFSEHIGWDVPGSGGSWIRQKSPALLLFWRTPVPLIARLSAAQRVTLVLWPPPSHARVRAPMQAPLRVDPVLVDLDRCPAPSPPSGGKDMDQDSPAVTMDSSVNPGIEEEPIVVAKTYASVAKSRTAKTAGQGLLETMEILDGYFDLDRLLGGKAIVSDMLQMPLPRALKSA
ncbi:hypothetical protein PoB_004910900 [Plakobranchus ocellatus]|uniref:Uncharacterized protein n=1 Tax=Plakobranchus ocellatus TaxID=259542 RepID=A0AAV4BW19_9GAST|nr:hypothetical protein PoB_004910900 [Plakobranchus ocellatus]